VIRRHLANDSNHSSPVLFCVYIDGLLTALASANVGCYIGRNYVGALAYADDLVLTAPSASALRKMLTMLQIFTCRSMLASPSVL